MKSETALKKLKEEYIALEMKSQEEKECLLGLLRTFTFIVRDKDDINEEVVFLKNMIDGYKKININKLNKLTSKLKKKYITSQVTEDSTLDKINNTDYVSTSSSDSHDILHRLVTKLLNDFYPGGDDLRERAEQFKAALEKKVLGSEFFDTAESFLDYVDQIKVKITQDYHDISTTFTTLFDQIKTLERTLFVEFAGDRKVKDIAAFEMKINAEVTSLVQSLNVTTTLNEIKMAVRNKIDSIKKIVSVWKNKEVKKIESAHRRIRILQERIAGIEKDAQELSRKAEQFQMAAMLDDLTGLFNRKAFDVKLRNVFRNYATGKHTFCLIMFDIDNFKKINDSFGHTAGDKVLLKVTQCLREAFRKNDFISRYGGDEFVAVIENIDERIAEERIAEFKASLKKRRFTSLVQGEVEVNVSAGLAMPQANDTVEALLARADEAMYSEKNSER